MKSGWSVILIGNVWICFRSGRQWSDCYYAKLVIKFSISNRYPQTSANNELEDTAGAKCAKNGLFAHDVDLWKISCALEIRIRNWPHLLKSIGVDMQINSG